MTTKTPIDSGWYWVENDRGEWFMVSYDADREIMRAAFDADDSRARHPGHIIAWHGPFNCPGGPFGAATVVPDADTHDLAKAEGKAIVIQYASYRHCADENHGSSVTMFSLMSRDEAEAAIGFRNAAQAQVFSAAPEMLDALKAIASEAGGRGQLYVNIVKSVRQIARDAIAKAEAVS